MSTTRRVLSGTSALLNCLTAGAPFTFPLWSPSLERVLHLSAAQLNLVASAAILGEYALAAYFGALCDRRGPGAVSFVASALFAIGFSLLSWRYRVGLAADYEPWQGEWAVLAACWFVVGCGTAGSYFSGVISSTKSAPARHSGFAIAVPCAVFGLSPLALSAIASFFTSETKTTSSGDDLDVAGYLACLGVVLTLVNLAGGLLIKELPWDDNIDKVLVDAVEPFDRERLAAVEGSDSGFVASCASTFAEPATERTSLLQRSTTATPEPPVESESLRSFASTASFWLLGAVIFLSTGPAEMYMASLGSILASLAPRSFPRGAPSNALALRKRHIALLAIVNTAWRLVVGAASDYLAAPPSRNAHNGQSEPAKPRASWRRHVRLIFVLGACVLLAAAYGWGATGLAAPAGLWAVTAATAVSYGTVFTLTPALVRTRWSVADFGRNWGLLTWFSALGSLLFTPLFGLLRDLASSRGPTGDNGDSDVATCFGPRCYRPIFALSSVSAALAAVLVCVLARRWSRRTWSQ
ncbi:hypothetical protein Rhopal_000257-T1 [Rhodotorula paludigena]|uniref:MFS monocarboxylic acid transporter n=1 Tax=Rhodotorula paludigena TaxID=86838 RepID=A0AAV5GA53_9BASI|nr:hypothetical protein Rhopal_000257-T1 [Rhodotorula paludigena]